MKDSQKSFKKVNSVMIKKSPAQEAESIKIFTNFSTLPVAKPIQMHKNKVIHGIVER